MARRAYRTLARIAFYVRKRAYAASTSASVANSPRRTCAGFCDGCAFFRRQPIDTLPRKLCEGQQRLSRKLLLILGELADLGDRLVE
jgi:hypothetical protein